VEDRCWVQVGAHARVFAIADEDLDRENDEKTSAVHFLRFELTAEMVTALRSGAALGIGIDHSSYRHSVPELSEAARKSLLADLS
jgi:glycerol-3-phosphate dehydrogenase subunit C